MQVHHVGYGIRGFYRIARLGHLWEMTPKDAQQRLTILGFWGRHGLEATRDAFGVSRRTLFRWNKALREAGGNLAALAKRSCAPKRRRKPKTDPRLIGEIRRLRSLYPNLGKDKLQVILRPWCAESGIALPSASSIGRIIARVPDKMRTHPVRIDPRGRLKPLGRPAKPRKPKQASLKPLVCLATDTVEIIRDGIRRYITTFIDPVSRFAFAWACPSKHAKHTHHALTLALWLLPQKPRTLLSDNGSEFEGVFAQHLAASGIARWYTYPKSPKMNAHLERFNRTLQESFVAYHQDLLMTDIDLFNRNLAHWLVFYNSQRPHHSLANQSPLQFLLQHHPQCQRYWTYTFY